MTLNKIVVVAIVVLFAALGINNIVDNQNKLKLKNIQLKSRAAELKSLELKYDHLQIELNKTDATNKEQIKKLEEERTKLLEEQQRLQKELSLKQEAKRLAAQKLQNAASLSATAYASSDACGALRARLAAKGIVGSELNAAITLATRESSCRPSAYNPSGACGEFQSLPCGKWGAPGTDGYLSGAIGYVKARYGSFGAALAHSYAHNWY